MRYNKGKIQTKPNYFSTHLSKADEWPDKCGYEWTDMTDYMSKNLYYFNRLKISVKRTR